MFFGPYQYAFEFEAVTLKLELPAVSRMFIQSPNLVCQLPIWAGVHWHIFDTL